MIATARWVSRLEQVGEIVDTFRFSLPHPDDFHPSRADVCWRQEVREVIVDGTDQEFENCKLDIQSKISEWSATWLEERRKALLGVLPQASPTIEHLSLATTLFSCTTCSWRDSVHMHIDDALTHHCSHCEWSGGLQEMFPNQNSRAVYRKTVGTPWNSGLGRYQYSANDAKLVRVVLLECGENPEIITTQEMNRKHHRFASFESDGKITVISWFEAVSCKPPSPRRSDS